MKKVFSLLLVGVVAVSMFGFIAPTRAEAVEDYKGTVYLHNFADEEAIFIISFSDGKGISVEPISVCSLKNGGGYPIEIPKNTEVVDITVDYDFGILTRTFLADCKESSDSIIDACCYTHCDQGKSYMEFNFYYTEGCWFED